MYVLFSFYQTFFKLFFSLSLTNSVSVQSDVWNYQKIKKPEQLLVGFINFLIVKHHTLTHDIPDQFNFLNHEKECLCLRKVVIVLYINIFI